MRTSNSQREPVVTEICIQAFTVNEPSNLPVSYSVIPLSQYTPLFFSEHCIRQYSEGLTSSSMWNFSSTLLITVGVRSLLDSYNQIITAYDTVMTNPAILHRRENVRR